MIDIYPLPNQFKMINYEGIFFMKNAILRVLFAIMMARRSLPITCIHDYAIFTICDKNWTERM
jgi:hypothetical protein